MRPLRHLSQEMEETWGIARLLHGVNPKLLMVQKGSLREAFVPFKGTVKAFFMYGQVERVLPSLASMQVKAQFDFLILCFSHLVLGSELNHEVFLWGMQPVGLSGQRCGSPQPEDLGADHVYRMPAFKATYAADSVLSEGLAVPFAAIEELDR